MDAHAVDGQGSSTQMAGAAALQQSNQLCQSCTSSAVWKLWAHNKLSGLQFEHQTRNGVDACWCYLPGSCAAPGHMFARSHWAPLLGEVLALHAQHFWFIEKLWLGAFSCVPTADDLWRLSDNLMTALNSRQLFSFVLVDQITCVENSVLYTSRAQTLVRDTRRV